MSSCMHVPRQIRVSLSISQHGQSLTVTILPQYQDQYESHKPDPCAGLVPHTNRLYVQAPRESEEEAGDLAIRRRPAQRARQSCLLEEVLALRWREAACVGEGR